MTYNHELSDIKASPGASYWLKAAVTSLDHCDPLDALRDAEVLLDVQRQRWAEIEAEVATASRTYHTYSDKRIPPKSYRRTS